MRPEATVKEYLTVQIEGSRQVERRVDHYNLGAIISVGYRVYATRIDYDPGAGVPNLFFQTVQNKMTGPRRADGSHAGTISHETARLRLKPSSRRSALPKPNRGIKASKKSGRTKKSERG